MTTRTSADFVADIVRAADDAAEFVAGFTLDGFAADKRTWNATVRVLLVIGEAAKRVSDDVKAHAPQVPWRVMAGMRDRLVHNYNDIRLDVVWRTATEDIPPLLAFLRPLRDALLAEESRPTTEGE